MKAKYVGFSVLVTSVILALLSVIGFSVVSEWVSHQSVGAWLFKALWFTLGYMVTWGIVEMVQETVYKTNRSTLAAFFHPWVVVGRFLGKYFDYIMGTAFVVLVVGSVVFGSVSVVQGTARDMKEREKMKAEIVTLQKEVNKYKTLNMNLEQRVVDLTHDNLAYQDSMRRAASVGIKVPHRP